MTADRIAAMDARPDAPESQRVRIARALYEADMDPEEFWTVKWESAYGLHDKYLRLADAALAVRLTPAGDPAAAVGEALEAMYRSKWAAWAESLPPDPAAPLSVESRIAWVRVNQVLDCKEAVTAALVQPAPADGAL